MINFEQLLWLGLLSHFGFSLLPCNMLIAVVKERIEKQIIFMEESAARNKDGMSRRLECQAIKAHKNERIQKVFSRYLENVSVRRL